MVESIVGELDYSVQQASVDGTYAERGGVTSSYGEAKLMTFLLQELVKTSLRIEHHAKHKESYGSHMTKLRAQSTRRDEIDLEFYTYLQKGSVWQLWKREFYLFKFSPSAGVLLA